LDLWSAFGNIDLGWAEAELGDVEKGIERMRQGLAAYQATGARLWRPHFLYLLAGTLSKAEQAEEGLAVAKEALALADSTGERYSTAELYRLQGALMMRVAGQRSTPRSGMKRFATGASDHSYDAESCFAKGLQIAMEQGAKSWESRLLATMQQPKPSG
jgi:predicted ATPase